MDTCDNTFGCWGAERCRRVAEAERKVDICAPFPCEWNELTVPVSPVELALGGES